MLTRITLRGWRSYDIDSGIELAGLRRVTLIVGPNNFGKSNLHRFLIWLRSSLIDHPKWKNDAPFGVIEHAVPIASQETWMSGRGAISAEFELLPDPSWKVPPPLLTPAGHLRVVLTLDCPWPDAGRLTILPLIDDTQPLLRRADPSASWELYSPEEGWGAKQYTASTAHLAAHVADFFATRVVDIQALRDPTRQRATAIGSSPATAALAPTTDGSQTLADLHALATDRARDDEWSEFSHTVGSWLQQLLDEPSPPRVDALESDLRLTFVRPGKPLTLRLQDVGTGVVECVMVLAFLWLHRKQPCVVTIDEPEAHLHPAAALALMRIVERDLPQHQLLVASHSTALVDGIGKGWKLFRASRRTNFGTRLHAVDTPWDGLALLADLGVRPSQMFLANCLVWVEGPSDAIYARRLMADHPGSKRFLEGRDYSFVLYGGACLSHLAIDDAGERLVQCFRLSPHNVIVADRDTDSIDDVSLKNRVIRLMREADAHPSNATVVPLAPGIREIENLLKPDVLVAAVRENLSTFDSKGVALSASSIHGSGRFNEELADGALLDGQPTTTAQARGLAAAISARKTSIAGTATSSAADLWSSEAAAVAQPIAEAILRANQA